MHDEAPHGLMSSVIGQILPLALAVALSTIPIIAALLILLSPAKPLVSVALLIGWAAGIALVLTILTIGVRLLPSSSPPRDDTVIGVVRIFLGAALIASSIVAWRKRPHRTAETPRWMDALGRMKAAGALGFGFALALRPKNLILSVAAAVVIGDASLKAPDVVVIILVFTVVGISTVAAPIVGHFSAPEKTRRPLNAARDWMTNNSATLMLIVAIVIGVVIVGSGISKL